MQKKKPLNVLYEGMNYYKKKMILIYPDRIFEEDTQERTNNAFFYLVEKNR